MRQVLYGDVLCLINFSIDFLVLAMCGTFLHLRRRLFRLLAAAVLGAVYSLLILLPALPWYAELLSHLIAALLMCAVAYSPLGARYFVRLVFVFYVSAFLLGGAVSALYTILASILGTADVGETNAVVSGQKATIFLLYAMGSGIFFFAFGRMEAKRKCQRHTMVKICEEEKSVEMEGLVDSGNLLSDPISGRPVILVRKVEALHILPMDIARFYSGMSEEKDVPPALMKKIRLVLATGVEGKRILTGYIPDRIFLFSREEPKKRRTVNAMIAICEGQEKDFGGSGAIVPATLL